MSKNSRLLAWFSDYCRQHPEERFWQALRNWSGSAFILKARNFDFNTSTFIDIEDTYYIE